LEFVKQSQAAGQQRLGHVLLHPFDRRQIETLNSMLKQIREHAFTLITDAQKKSGNIPLKDID
jgi:hypothetical protein